MKLTLFLVTVVLCALFGQDAAQLVYPWCRCCDIRSQAYAVQNLIRWCSSFQSCSPIHDCIRRCLYSYNNTIILPEYTMCSIGYEDLFNFYKWFIYNYQCLPKSLFKCLKYCATAFEPYPSCYWTINADVGVQIGKAEF